MSDTTGTPITDAARQKFRGDTDGLCRELIKTSNDLERQLAEARGKLTSAERREADQIELRELNLKQLTDAREQRDRLAEALREIIQSEIDQSVQSYGLGDIAKEALATLDRKEAE